MMPDRRAREEVPGEVDPADRAQAVVAPERRDAVDDVLAHRRGGLRAALELGHDAEDHDRRRREGADPDQHRVGSAGAIEEEADEGAAEDRGLVDRRADGVGAQEAVRRSVVSPMPRKSAPSAKFRVAPDDDRGDEHEREPVVPGERGERVEGARGERRRRLRCASAGAGRRCRRRACREGGEQQRHVDEAGRDRRRLRGVAAREEHPGEHELELALHGRREAVGADQRGRPARGPSRSHSAVQLWRCAPSAPSACGAPPPRRRRRRGAGRSREPGRTRRRRPAARPPAAGRRRSSPRSDADEEERGRARGDGRSGPGVASTAASATSRSAASSAWTVVEPVSRPRERGERRLLRRDADPEAVPLERARRTPRPVRAGRQTIPIRSCGSERLLPRLRITTTSSARPKAEASARVSPERGLVRLVGDDEQPVLLGQRRRRAATSSRQRDVAGRVAGIAEEQGPGARADRRARPPRRPSASRRPPSRGRRRERRRRRGSAPRRRSTGAGTTTSSPGSTSERKQTPSACMAPFVTRIPVVRVDRPPGRARELRGERLPQRREAAGGRRLHRAPERRRDGVDDVGRERRGRGAVQRHGLDPVRPRRLEPLRRLVGREAAGSLTRG